MRPLVNLIDRIPINERTSEANYEVVITTDGESAEVAGAGIRMIATLAALPACLADAI